MFAVGDYVRVRDNLNVPETHRGQTGTVSLVEPREVYRDSTFQWVTVDLDGGGVVRLIDGEVERVEVQFRGHVELYAVGAPAGDGSIGVAVEDFQPVAEGEGGQWHVVKAECPE